MILPNFIIAGAKKAATSSLYEYMKQHPQVYLSPIKETKFFAYEPDNPEHAGSVHKKFPIHTLEEYARLFEGVKGEIAIGEASPIYINSSYAMRRIQALIPQVRLIFSLRNPVDRAYSAYLMRVRGGYEHRPVEQAFREDLNHLRSVSYYTMLKQWYALFPAEQIKVVLYEDIRKDAVAVVQELFAFVGVESSFTPDVSVQHNSGGVAKSQVRQHIVNYLRRYRSFRFYLPQSVRSLFTNWANGNLTKAPTMPTEVRQLLNDLYAVEVDQLEALTGKDLAVWQLRTQAQPVATPTGIQASSYAP